MKPEKLMNKAVNETNNALSAYQKWLNSNNGVRINELDWSGFSNDSTRRDAVVNEIKQAYKEAGLILDDSSIPNIKHDIPWGAINAAYRAEEELTKVLFAEYEKQGQVYGGRTLFNDYDAANIESNGNYDKFIRTTYGTKLSDEIGWGGFWSKGKWHGNYLKLNNQTASINKRVIEQFWDKLYAETNKHLLEKFNEFDGDLSTQGFSKKIKITTELLADTKKAKQWAKEVEQIVKNAKAFEIEKRKIKNSINSVIKNKPLLNINQLEQIGRAILGLSTEYCPIRTGFLRSSGTLYIRNNSIQIMYECPYATYVHDNINNIHPIGRAKFLEEAAQDILQNRSVWTENTGFQGSLVDGTHMYQKYDNGTKQYTWIESKGYSAVYIEIDTNLRVNYHHYS